MFVGQTKRSEEQKKDNGDTPQPRGKNMSKKMGIQEKIIWRGEQMVG